MLRGLTKRLARRRRRRPAAPISTPLLIGMSARIHHGHELTRELGGVYTKTLHYLEQSVAHWVMSKNVLVLMIPAIESEGLLRRSDMRLYHYAEALDGLVLQGGADMAPETYRQQAQHPDWAGDRVRDRYEIELFEAFVGKGKPVLGICRGCQVINVAFGGTLYQDIGTQVPQAIEHRDITKYERNFHKVKFLEGTRLAALYPGRREATINTIHHQAVDKLGRGLVVEALSVPDNIVEAVRWRGPSYVFGVQWHPEFMIGESMREEHLDGSPILNEFLEAARRRKPR
ncbi:MAG TPA: gamma-glutamyl-gamma-aminobutyrate hydrolase family protein [Casimicrobiaceae bacterium]|nr:gamma-glutamyl-gamma-aminobutyrate hydrolase family protein [Casimicrobiaceae bacterium]